MASDVKWIKITTDIFDDEKILLIEALPDAYAIITVWFKLLCLAGKQNNSGVFLIGKIAYTDKMLATIFRMKEATVTMALQTFEQLEMVEIVDGVITIPNWGKHQNLDQLEAKKEYMRNYMTEYRQKQKQLTTGKPSCKTNSKANVSQADKEEEKELDSDEDNKSSSTKKKPKKDRYGAYQNVLLTENEYENLGNSFGWDMREKAISFLDEYIEEKGYKSKSHNLAIRRWVIEAVQKKEVKPNGRKEMVPKWIEPPSGKLSQLEIDAIHRIMNKKDFLRDPDEPPTAASDPDIADRAEKLKQRLGE